jgi:predicted porin
MKRKALVAAIAGILSAPAVAAIDDAGMKYTSASEGFYGSIRVPLVIEDDKDADLNEGGQSSRMGVRGSVDLGGGLSSTYRYEWDIQAGDDFATLRLRQLGLNGAFGTVTFGQQWNVDYDYVFVLTDVTQNDTGNFAEAFRWSSSARYDSPDLNGFKFGAQVQMHGEGDDKADGNDDVDQYAVGASYNVAGFTVSGTYIGEKNKVHGSNANAIAAFAGTFPATSTADSGDYVAANNQTEDPGGETDNTIGVGLGYGQDNWQVNYFFKQSDALGSDYRRVADGAAVDAAQVTSNAATDDVFVAENGEGEHVAHSLAGQVSFDKLTLRGVYEINEHDAGALGTFDNSIFVGELQYDLGSRSRVWIAFKNTDDDLAEDEVTKYTLGYRVDF